MQPVHLPRKLPEILSPDEVKRPIAAAGNLKHQTALALAYATGLRVNEVVNLKVGDIDSQRMTLRVEQSKGQKDRYAMLSPLLLERLTATLFAEIAANLQKFTPNRSRPRSVRPKPYKADA